jgi:cell division GTPase FtsZ
MRGSGSAVMGVATEVGEDRADRVIDKILTSPLFGDVSISGSRNVLVNISVSSSDGLTLNEAHRVRDRVQHHAKIEEENGKIRLTNIIWGVSIKPSLEENEMEVVIVATGFDNDDFLTGGTIKNGGDDGRTKIGGHVNGEESDGKPKYRPAPEPIVRPVRNIAEIEDCKRTPAYIAHGVTLSTATKTHAVAGVEPEEEQPAESQDVLTLF